MCPSVIHTHTHTHTYTHMHIYTHAYIHMDMYIYMYVRTYMYTVTRCSMRLCGATRVPCAEDLNMALIELNAVVRFFAEKSLIGLQ